MRSIAILSVAIVMAIAACGDDGGGTVPTLGTTQPPTTQAPAPGGTVPGAAVLPALRSGCESGDMVMCDVLFMAAPLGSDDEAYGDSCGGRNEPAEWCVDIYGVDIDLDALAGRCTGGEMLACDMLYMYAPFDSAAEALGDSCGGRGKSGFVCVTQYGLP
jgi:hypothetical protein